MDGGDGQRCTHANSKTRTATAREGRSPTSSGKETEPPKPPPRRSGESRPVGAFGARKGRGWPGGGGLARRVRHRHYDGPGAGTVRPGGARAGGGKAGPL